MSTKPRVSSAIEGQEASVGTVLAQAPALAQAFGELYAVFWQSEAVPQDLKEMTRLRNARITDCGF